MVCPVPQTGQLSPHTGFFLSLGGIFWAHLPRAPHHATGTLLERKRMALRALCFCGERGLLRGRHCGLLDRQVVGALSAIQETPLVLLHEARDERADKIRQVANRLGVSYAHSILSFLHAFGQPALQFWCFLHLHAGPFSEGMGVCMDYLLRGLHCRQLGSPLRPIVPSDRTFLRFLAQSWRCQLLWGCSGETKERGK